MENEDRKLTKRAKKIFDKYKKSNNIKREQNNINTIAYIMGRILGNLFGIIIVLSFVYTGYSVISNIFEIQEFTYFEFIKMGIGLYFLVIFIKNIIQSKLY